MWLSIIEKSYSLSGVHDVYLTLPADEYQADSISQLMDTLTKSCIIVPWLNCIQMPSKIKKKSVTLRRYLVQLFGNKP